VVTFLSILLTITSILLIVLVLLHRGKGGGLSSLGGSAVVEKNLDRLTIVCGLVWAVSIIALGLLLKEIGAPVVPS
jgi:preprotein translocase subunit SecG